MPSTSWTASRAFMTDRSSRPMAQVPLEYQWVVAVPRNRVSSSALVPRPGKTSRPVNGASGVEAARYSYTSTAETSVSTSARSLRKPASRAAGSARPRPAPAPAQRAAISWAL